SMAPNEFNVVATQDAKQFETKLSQQQITFSKNAYETITVDNVWSSSLYLNLQFNE
ncbi:hypothetical protein IDG68_14985, partial [Staphylococcus sp. EG-SA-21]|nr:hypothetical protein [Staphylococcus sp. EG-SA-21]